MPDSVIDSELFKTILSVFRDVQLELDIGPDKHICNRNESFAVLLLNSYVGVTLHQHINNRWGYTKFKAHYFVINNTVSDGKLIFS